MFSSFGQATQNSSSAVNPFAVKSNPFAQKANPFATAGANAQNPADQNGRGAQSDSENRGKVNGFKDNDAQLSDGGKSKHKRGDDRNKKNRENGGHRPKDAPSRNATQNRHVEAVNTDTTGNDSYEGTIGTAQQSNDPHAIRVYTQLRKDGISPPNWPSQPGNPNNKAAMAKFRERYEQYREKVRASLVKSGLIDDPSKRKTLSDAIDFKGICEDMCPEYEKITRITEIDVHQPEKDPETGYAINARMVKKLARSAAGQEAPLPMDVRSVPTLRRTLDYLIDDLLQNDDKLTGLHGFLWDRTRAIRRDFTFFSSLTPEELKTQVYVLENIARFHVTSLHLLSQEGNRPEDFVEQQELEQLGKALLSLRDLYDDCNDQGIECENEAEFRAYYLIFHGSDPNIIEILQRQWRPSLWKDSDEVRTAVSLVEAMQNTKDFHGPLKEAPSLAASAAHHAYFRIVEDPSISYTMACFAECHFARLRRSILSSITRALARPKDAAKDVTAADLNRFLRFDTVNQAIAFAELHDLSFQPDEDHPADPARQRLLLSLGKRLPHHRLQHQYSESLVEKKRGSHSLPEIIHGTVFEDPNAAKGNLFKKDTKPSASQRETFKPKQGDDTLTGVGKPQDIFGGNTANGTTAVTNPFQSQTKPAMSTDQPPANPFASGLQAPTSLQKPAINPFAPASKADTTPSPFSLAASGNAIPEKQPLPAGSANATASTATPQTAPGFFAPKATDSAQQPSFEAESNAVKPSKPNPFTSPPPQLLGGAKPATVGGLLSQVPFPGSQASEEAPKPKVPTFGFPPSQTNESAPAQSDVAASALESGQGDGQVGGLASALSASTSPLKPFPSFSASAAQPERQGGLLTKTSSDASAQQAMSLLPLAPQKSTTPSVSPPQRPAQPVQSLGSAKPTVPPAILPGPPRDLMGDFTRWFVLGDNGLLDEFRNYMTDNILSKVYDEYVQQQREEAQREEEESLAAEAEAFRVYNTQLKFFYRWKRNARAKRMRFLRLQGREKQRQYYQSQREAEMRHSQTTSLRKAKQRAQLSLVDRPAELSSMLVSKKRNRAETEDALIASGVLDGMIDERRVAKRIVSREYTPTSDRPSTGNSARESTSSRKSGGKTAALREKFFGDKSVGFRKSLPSMSSSPESSASRTRVSDRWRLKAMGIVKLPDGTAVPESLANDMMHRRKAFPGWTPGITSTPASRRGSLASDIRPTVERSASHSRAFADSLLQKRKRPAEDDGAVANEGQAKSHKRVMSEGGEELGETYQLIAEMRAMREELEEGTQWFKEQNDRMQSETHSRGTTPWDESI